MYCMTMLHDRRRVYMRYYYYDNACEEVLIQGTSEED